MMRKRLNMSFLLAMLIGVGPTFAGELGFVLVGQSPPELRDHLIKSYIQQVNPQGNGLKSVEPLAIPKKSRGELALKQIHKNKEYEDPINKLIGSESAVELASLAFGYGENGDIKTAKRLWEGALGKAEKEDPESYRDTISRIKLHLGAILLGEENADDRDLGATYVVEGAIGDARHNILQPLLADEEFAQAVGNTYGRPKINRQKAKERLFKILFSEEERRARDYTQ